MRSPSGRRPSPRAARVLAAVLLAAAWPREGAAQTPPPLAEFGLGGCGYVIWGSPGYGFPFCTAGTLRLYAVSPGDPFTAAIAATVVLPNVGYAYAYGPLAGGVLTPAGGPALSGQSTGVRAPLVGATNGFGEIFELSGCCVDVRSYHPLALGVGYTVVARPGYYEDGNMFVPPLVARVAIDLAATTVGAASPVPEPTPGALLAAAAALAALVGLAARRRARGR